MNTTKTILAELLKGFALLKRLKAVAPTFGYGLGCFVLSFAIVTSGCSPAEKDDGAKDAEACTLLKQELDRLNPIDQLYHIRVISPNPEVIKRDSDAVFLRYICEIRPMEDVYFNVFVPRMTKLFDQISIKKPRKFKIKIKENETVDYESRLASDISGYDYKIILYSAGHPDSHLLPKTYLELDAGENKGGKEPVFSLITEMDIKRKRATGIDYYLSDLVAKEYQKWETHYFSSAAISYKLQLLNNNGSVVAESDFDIQIGNVLKHASFSGDFPWDSAGFSRAMRVEWAPLCNYSRLGDACGYMVSQQLIVYIRVPRRDLTQVKSTRIVLNKESLYI